MTAVVLTGHGGLDQLVLRNNIPTPRPGPEDVLIEVRASAVNNTDLNTRLAWYSKSKGGSEDASWSGKPIEFPRIQGADVCGRVVATGDRISQDLVGQRVLVEPCLREAGGQTLKTPWYLGSECDGGFARYTKVAARHAYPIQSSYTDTELASFPCSYSTALNMLHRASVSEGDTVLVTGASGGVGSAAVQLAKAKGATVFAITSSNKSDSVKKLGADRTILRSEDLLRNPGKNSVDVVLDLVAGENWPNLLELLKPFGRYASSGAIAGPLVELDVRTLYLKDLSLFGCTVLGETVFSELIHLIESETIKPVVAGTFALSQIREAQEAFERKRHTGKLVIYMRSSS